MSKGSKDRTKDRKKYNASFDRVFGKKHFGDPCIYCGIDWDKWPIGVWRGGVNDRNRDSEALQESLGPLSADVVV